MAHGSLRWGSRGGRFTMRGALVWITVVVALAAVGGSFLPVLVAPSARAETVARVVVTPAAPGSPVPDTSAHARGEALDTVVGLAATPAVQEEVARRAGADPDTVAAGLVAAPGEDADAGFVDVRADGPTPDVAGRVLTAAVAVLADGLARADADGLRATLGPLSAQMQDLANALRALPPGDPGRGVLEQRYGALATVIAERTASPAPRLLPGGPPVLTPDRRPWPVTTAGIAGLVALLLAVPVALLATRGQRPSGTDPTHGLTSAVPGARAFLVWSDDAPAVLTRFWVGAVRGGGPVLVLQLSGRDRVDLARELAAAGRLIGDTVTLRDLTPGAPPPEPITGRAVVVSALRTPTTDGPALTVLRAAAPAVVLAIDTAGVGRADIASALAAVRSVDRAVRGIVVWRGRLPREESWAEVTAPAPAAQGERPPAESARG